MLEGKPKTGKIGHVSYTAFYMDYLNFGIWGSGLLNSRAKTGVAKRGARVARDRNVARATIEYETALNPLFKVDCGACHIFTEPTGW